MDCQKLIERLRDQYNCNVLDDVDDAANAIETLLAENRRLNRENLEQSVRIRQLEAEKRTEKVEDACKVGDTVYQTDGVRVYTSTINRIIYDTENIGFDDSAIGKAVFLTREEAEAAMRKEEV